MPQVYGDHMLADTARKRICGQVNSYVSGTHAVGANFRARGETKLSLNYRCQPSLVGNQISYVLWKEFMPVFRPFLGIPRHAPTVCGCLVTIASMLADVLGWYRNPSLLPITHERFFQLSTALEREVRPPSGLGVEP
jgi:hypothetical protein